MAAKYWISKEIVVDRSTERELANNGEQGDARVRLVAARDDDGNTYYYLQTNGDPVVLQMGDVDHNRTFCETLGLSPNEIISILEVDGNGDDYDTKFPCEELRVVEKEIARRARTAQTDKINQLQRKHPKTKRQRHASGTENFVEFIDKKTGKCVARYSLEGERS